MQGNFLSPAEIAKYVVDVGQKKAGLSPFKQLLLGVLAGAFIALAAQGSNAAIHTVESIGLGKTLAGALFAAGLILVIVAGGELFTGNSLMVAALADRKISLPAMLRGWCLVYLGNLVGSVLVAFFVLKSGQLVCSGGLLGGFTLKLVAFGAGDVAGKILAIFFPIWLFVASGFEHSIANMYYIPAGILAKADPLFVEKALELGASQQAIDALGWGSMFSANLLPVTLGNILGGAFFVGLAYWLAYRRAA